MLFFMLVLGIVVALTPPLSCKCVTRQRAQLDGWVKSITCSGLPQSEIPSVTMNFSSAVEVLRFSETTFRRVDFFAFRRLPGLLVLELNNVGVSEVVGTGKSLQKLNTLDLSENSLHLLQPYAFRDFPNLGKLNLSGNGLHTLSPSAFVLPQLKILDLRRNRLADLKAHFFADATHLQELYLSNNLLSIVASFVFTHNINVLDLSHNHIIRLEDGAFEGINISEVLNLGQNSLRKVPNTALKRLGFVKRLILDGNPFHLFGLSSVVGLSVISLSVSYHKNLHLVHRDAFLNLVDLEELVMRGNPALTYIHPRSIINAPKLSVVDLSNNALFTLEEEFIESAPGITNLSIVNNSFACHCSLKWLRTCSNEEITCSQRTSASVTTLDQLSNLSSTCSPYIIPLFPTTYHETLGNNVSFHCRALGTKDLKVFWLTKSGQRLYNGNCAERLCVVDLALTILYLHHSDTGSYTCMARDVSGADSRSVGLQVRDVNVHLFALTVTSTFVTLAWNLSNAISNSYMLRYEEKYMGDSNESLTTPNPQSVTFSVGPKMHSYTVHGLRPGMTYSFYLCIQREEYTIVITSTSVTTRDEDFLLTLGIERSYLSVIFVSIAAGILFASCTSFCAIRCWRQRLKSKQHRQQEQQQSRLAKSESGLSACPILQSSSTHSDMAVITYINLTEDIVSTDQSIESTLIQGFA